MTEFVHTLTLDMSKDLTMDRLKGFTNAAPADAKVDVLVATIEPDRPYESRQTKVSLQASWSNKK